MVNSTKHGLSPDPAEGYLELLATYLEFICFLMLDDAWKVVLLI